MTSCRDGARRRAVRMSASELRARVSAKAAFVLLTIASLGLAGVAVAVLVYTAWTQWYYDRGLELLTLGRHEEALAAFDQATRLGPGDPLALALCFSGMLPGACGAKTHAWVHECDGRIAAVEVFGGEQKDQAYVWETIADDEGSGSRVQRVLRLDLARGEVSLVNETSSQVSNELLYDFIAVSEDGGRVAWTQRESAQPYGGPWCVLVGNEWSEATQVSRFDEHLPAFLEWNADGTSLAYLSLGPDLAGRLGRALVSVVPRDGGAVETTMLTGPDSQSMGVAWAPGGERLYHLVYEADGDRCVESVKWPSVEREKLMVSPNRLGPLSVATATGQVVVLEPLRGESGSAVWRVHPGSGRERTAARLDEGAFRAVVSPDGEWLAVIPPGDDPGPHVSHGSGVVVYSLEDGTSYIVKSVEGESVASVNWVLAGRALLVAEDARRIWLVPVDAPQ